MARVEENEGAHVVVEDRHFVVPERLMFDPEISCEGRIAGAFWFARERPPTPEELCAVVTDLDPSWAADYIDEVEHSKAMKEYL